MTVITDNNHSDHMILSLYGLRSVLHFLNFFGPLSRPTDFLSLVLLLSFVQMILLVQELPFPAVSGGVPIIFVVNEIIKVKVINISDECSRSKVMFQSTNQTLLIGI